MPIPFGGPGGSLSGLMFTLVPLIVLAGFIYVIVSGLSTWMRNNQQPVDTRPARVYGEIAQGDVGMLTSRGTRFHGFGTGSSRPRFCLGER